MAIGNFLADLHPDLTVANVNSNTVSVLLGNGNGTFQARSDFGAGSQPYSVAIADFHADGWPDLAVANSASHTVSILSNRSPSVVDVPPPISTTVPAAFDWAVLPNPFTRSIQLSFSLPSAGRVKVDVFNVLGQRVARVIDKTLPAARHEVQWDGRDLRGRVVASGSYFFRLETEGLRETRKVVKIE